jgi:hypothetical protein
LRASRYRAPKPALEPRREALRCLIVPPGAETGGGIGVFEYFALRVAAADARQLRKSGAEALGRTVVVAARKCGRAGAQGRHDRALRQPPAFEQLAELRDARCKRGVVAAGGFGQRRMHIGERDASAREISRGMRNDLAPCIVEWRHLAVDLPAPQERCRIGQIEQRRRV